MSKPSIVRGSDYHFSHIYEGNGEGQRVGQFVPFTDNGTIAKSCTFDEASSSYLSKTFSGDGNKTKFTFSMWMKRHNIGSRMDFVSFRQDVPLLLNADNTLTIALFGDTSRVTTRTFEDCSKWYHIVLRVDSSQSTADDRIKLYIDGEQITSFSTTNNPSQDEAANIYTVTREFYFGNILAGSYYTDASFAEVHYCDGQSYGPDTFGVTDTSTGRWVPKSLGSITYGTNGFRLEFANSAGQTIGDDTSGQGNDLTVNNMGSDHIRIDSPTQNFLTMSENFTGVTHTEGALKVTTPSSGGGYNQCVSAPMGVSKGKWYWEVRINTKGAAAYGWKSDNNTYGSQSGATGTYKFGPAYNVGGSGGFADGEWDCNYSTGASPFSAFATSSAGDIISFAIDLDNRKGYVAKNGTWFNSGNPANGTGSIGLGHNPEANVGAKFYPMCLRLDGSGVGTYNFGQNPSFCGQITAAANTASSGPGLFKYTPPTDFKAICQDNFSESEPYLNTETDRGIPDLVWIKNRDTTDSHQWYDSTRGVTKVMASDATSAESTVADGLQKFLKGGFAVEDDVSVNTGDESYVAWNWVANGGTTSANTDGSGATLASTIQANQTAGFSIVQVTAPGSPSGTYKIAHGLSAAPQWIIGKNQENGGGYNWQVYHHKTASDAHTDYLELNTTDAYADDATVWGDTAPTSSVFTVGTGVPLLANEKTIFYCWTPIEGYSKFNLYLGNADANGPFIYTGFKPAWLMLRPLASGSWIIIDNTRNPINPINRTVWANLTTAESTSYNWCDFLANGFKLRDASNGLNNSGAVYMYMAFAERPFMGDGVNPGQAV